MTRPRTRTLAAAAAALALMPAVATPAHAGVATVYQCAGPGGQVAAIDMVSSPPTSPAFRFYPLCADSQFPELAVVANLPNPSWLGSADQRELLVAGPTGTRIVGGQVERQMYGYRFSTDPGARSDGAGYRLTTAGRERVLERCGLGGVPGGCQVAADGSYRFPAPTLHLPAGLSTPTLRFSVGCLSGAGGVGQACYDVWGSTGIIVRRLALRVADLAPPTAAWATGSPATDGTVGRRELTLTASDTGLGLYRVASYVDGALVDVQPFSAASTACRDVNPRTPDPYEFATAHACPTGPTSTTLRLRGLPLHGEHVLRVVVEDAGGNRTVALERSARFALPADTLQCSRSGCVERRGVPNGAGATAQARLRLGGRATQRLAYGRRVTIRGRLTGAGNEPITGALIDVGGHTLRLRARPLPAREVRTGAQGGFRVVIAAGPSRVVRLAYRAHLGDAAPAQEASVRIRVRAGVRLGVRPAVVGPGRAVRVRGRVLGGPFTKGTFAELQALDGREWRTFKTLAVGRRGRFSYRYRFRHTSGPARFLWRVHVRAQAGLPYDAASSRPRWVLVR